MKSDNRLYKALTINNKIFGPTKVRVAGPAWLAALPTDVPGNPESKMVLLFDQV